MKLHLSNVEQAKVTTEEERLPGRRRGDAVSLSVAVSEVCMLPTAIDSLFSSTAVESLEVRSSFGSSENSDDYPSFL